MTQKPKKPARKSRSKQAPEFENDPTPERLRHAGDQIDGFETETRRVVKRVNSILDHMLSRGMIDGPLYQAGMLAYSQWHLGGLAPAGALDPSKERVDGGSSGDPMQRCMDNARKYLAAMASLSMPHRRAFEVLVLHEIHVAVFGLNYYGYRDVASARAVSYSILKDALSQIVEHYSGGKIKIESKGIRAHIDGTARATNRPDIREKVA